MKNICKYVGVLMLIVFSFFYTDRISKLFIYESDLMRDIINVKQEKRQNAQNAIINGNYIIPGLNGYEVDEINSYYQMKKDKKYSKHKLTFREIYPDVSINNNKNLIITKGNPSKNNVAIVVENNAKIINYSTNNNINLTMLINIQTYDKKSSFELINNDTLTSKDLDKILKKDKRNVGICFIQKKDCDNKFLVEPTVILKNGTINYDPMPGDIILIDNNYSLDKFIYLLYQINYRNLNIVFLSKLISEQRG